MEMGPALVGAGVKIIDLAADFRLRDTALFEKWYKMPHSATALLEESVYGLPEVNRDAIRKARVIGLPGCYPTSVQLGYKPALERGLIDASHLIADCKSGVSGAGRKAEVGILHAEAADNFKAYGVGGHRHHPEIVQGLSRMTAQPVGLVFTPHLTPMIRGIHSTLYARITKDADFQKVYEEAYAGEPFVDVMPPGSTPDTRSVRGANTCRIAVHRVGSGDTLMILSVIDNLTKGAAGQAVQVMNLMSGFPESAGLEAVGLVP
jgi:N-acetyl-gamma-glutamyl-phosphate reductase